MDSQSLFLDLRTLPDNRDTGRTLLDATYEGLVVARNDPEGLGRVKVLVPNILDPASDWLRPMATFGGSAQRGIFAVPKIGANVDVVFLHGDSRYARYIAGPWGRPSGVSDVPDQAPLGNPDIVVMRFGNFAMIYDERTGVEKLTILDVVKNSSITFDGVTGNVDVSSTGAVKITAASTIDVEAQGIATFKSATKAILEGALMEIGLGATEAMVLGTAFALLYNTHTQPVTMGGVAGPPTVPMTPGTHTSLITTVK